VHNLDLGIIINQQHQLRVNIIMMKIAAVVLLVSTAISGVNAFATSSAHQRASSTAIYIGRESNVDLSGNAWKPDSEKMGVSALFSSSYLLFERVFASSSSL
jgi:hypothetical protein